MKIWTKSPSYPKDFLSSRQAAKLFKYIAAILTSAFLRQKYSFLSNVNDNSNTIEKTKCFQIWVGIFQVGIFLGGNFPGQNSPRGGGDLIGGNFPGGSFPGGNSLDT